MAILFWCSFSRMVHKSHSWFYWLPPAGYPIHSYPPQAHSHLRQHCQHQLAQWCGVIFLQLWSWWPFRCKILRCICSVAFSPKLHPLAYMMCVPPHLVSVEVVYGVPLTKTHRYVFYWQVQLRCTQLPGWNTVFWQQCASHFSHIFSLSHFLREHSESTDGLPIPTKKL